MLRIRIVKEYNEMNNLKTNLLITTLSGCFPNCQVVSG